MPKLTGKRVSILAAASPSSDVANHSDTTDKMLNLVHYEAAATVMRPCDDQLSSHSQRNKVSSSSASLNNNKHRDMHQPYERKCRMTIELVRHAKNPSARNRCGSYGHWFNGHRSDGSIPEGVVSSRSNRR